MFYHFSRGMVSLDLTTATILPAYLLAFCRITIVFVFLSSSVGKALHFQTFIQTIRQFHLLPTKLSAPAAVLFFCGECVVVVFVGLGGQLLIGGFVLALLLLLAFCAALASVVARKIHTSCNCFGASEQEVSSLDIWRNSGFILCILGGCAAFVWNGGTPASLNLLEWVFIGLGSFVFVVIWIQLADIVKLFRQN